MKRLSAFLKLALVFAPLLASGVLAQSGAGYDLSRWAVAGGGATFSTGAGYSVGTTVGQPGAGTVAGGSYTIYGGFWQPASSIHPSPVYLPLVVRALPPPPPCPDTEPNEDPEHGQQLTTINGSCIGSFQTEPEPNGPYNADFYWVRPNSGQHIIVDLTGIASDADYDIALIRED